MRAFAALAAACGSDDAERSHSEIITPSAKSRANLKRWQAALREPGGVRTRYIGSSTAIAQA